MLTMWFVVWRMFNLCCFELRIPNATRIGVCCTWMHFQSIDRLETENTPHRTEITHTHKRIRSDKIHHTKPKKKKKNKSIEKPLRTHTITTQCFRFDGKNVVITNWMVKTLIVNGHCLRIFWHFEMPFHSTMHCTTAHTVWTIENHESNQPNKNNNGFYRNNGDDDDDGKSTIEQQNHRRKTSHTRNIVHASVHDEYQLFNHI